MNTEDRLRYCLAMIIIPTITLIIFGGLNYVHRVSNEVKTLQTEVKTKINLVEQKKQKIEEVTIEKEGLKQELDQTRLEKKRIEDELRKSKADRKAKEDSLEVFRITAYDTSIKSCGKSLNHPEYGITATGFSVKGKTRQQAMTVAVDPTVIKMGSRVRLIFLKKEFEYLNAVYVARDTGNAVKGRTIDIFFGDFGEKESSEVYRFGVQLAKVEIIK